MPTLFTTRDYRGATVEDLDIKPAISINPTTFLDEAIAIAFENEFNNLPVINEENKKLLGILNVESLKKIPKDTKVVPIVKNYMFWFHQKARAKYEASFEAKGGLKGSAAKPARTSPSATIRTPTTGWKYNVITPLTPLEDLSKFFNEGNYFAIITNDEGTFVYGVATPEDLMKYENSRPRL